MTRMAFRTCPLCEATCGLQLEVEDGHVTRIRGDADDPFSKGFICPKGSTLGALHEDPDRLRRPLVRRDGAHVEVSWDEAFAEIERRLTALVERARHRRRRRLHRQPERAQLRQHARDPAARQGARGRRTSTRPRPSTRCRSTSPAGSSSAIRSRSPCPTSTAPTSSLLLGANPLESNGSLATAPDWPGRLEAIRRRGGRVVVVDPRRTRTAEHADLHVPIRPGTDAALLAGIAYVLFAEGLADPGALADGVYGDRPRRSGGGRLHARARRVVHRRRRPTRCARSPVSSQRRRRRSSTAGSAPTRPPTGRSLPGSSTCSTS